MMDGWRRQKGDNYNQEATRTRYQNKKPPLGSWQPTVPSWEKKFCTTVGSVPWRKILETKKCFHLYDNVVNWNDSAGEEAFHNAKTRFWAKMSGLPCNISLPDPDLYIDEIDWNSKIDPELLLDLEREPVVPDVGEQDENVLILDNSLVSNQAFACTGWGDTEEDLKRVTNSSSDNNDNPWERNCGQSNGAVYGNGLGDSANNFWSWNQGNGNMGDIGRGDCWNNSWGWNQGVDNNYESKNLRDRSTDGVWGTWDVNKGRREGNGRYMSRYRTSRFHGDDHQRNHGRRNGRGRKKVNFVCEQPISTDKRTTSREWNLINSCGPVSHHASGEAGQTWSWEKPVS